MTWRIEPVGPEEVDRVVELVARSLPRGWGATAVARALEAPIARVVWALDAGERPVGIVLGRRVVDLLEIDQVGVLPEARRSGAATAMLEALLGRGTAEGLVEARLELADSNAAARGLYDRLGFVVVGRRARYYPDGDDALLLSRSL
jgi:ribosomal-protein-alanine N-acetyltransferase